MKRIRIHQWRGQCLLTRPPRPRCPYSFLHAHSNRTNSTQASQFSSTRPQLDEIYSGVQFSQPGSPSPRAALKSAKLAALHARLALPRRFPLQTLARTLVDKTANPDEEFNNTSLATLGSDVMGFYMSEYLISHYPRLPMDVLFAAQEAYVGPKALMTISKEWGVEEVAEPGSEVDPGLLQFKWAAKSTVEEKRGSHLAADGKWRSGSITSRIIRNDQFGDEIKRPFKEAGRVPTITAEDAAATFVRALMGAMQLHTGRVATKQFFDAHFLSRSLNLSQLFDFKYPTRDLSRLCLREGFEPPIARLVSESGRLSAHPIFVVGVYSGRDKLGEAVGGSLDEARNRAAAAALKGWYLYSPMDVTVPSETEDGKLFRANLVDPGEIIT